MAYADKETERWCLDHFLRARHSALGEILTFVCDSEAPDFICRRPNGELIGVEPTRIICNPERDELRRLRQDFDPESDSIELLWDSAVALAKKEAKRRGAH